MPQHQVCDLFAVTAWLLWQSLFWQQCGENGSLSVIQNKHNENNIKLHHLLWTWTAVSSCSFVDRVQRAKKVVSDSPGLMDFAIGLVNSVFNLPHGQLMFLRNSNNRRIVTSILLVKKFGGLVEITSGLVNASFNLPEWQAVKMIFFAPWE